MHFASVIDLQDADALFNIMVCIQQESAKCV